MNMVAQKASVNSLWGNEYAGWNMPVIDGLKPTERLFIEKTLLQIYPRLKKHDLMPWKWFSGPLIPDFIVSNTAPGLRRIVEIGCGDGLFSNTLSLLFPDIEIIGIDTNQDNIAYARSTIGYRDNLKFICANAAVLADIPCDRLIYNHCLSGMGSVYKFKKLIMKTSQWLVDEGDFIVKESPLAVFNQLSLLKELFPQFREGKSLEACIQELLREVGYPSAMTYRSQGLPGLPAEIFYQVARSLMLTNMLVKPANAVVSEWQDWGEQSNDSLVGFLFANNQTDFSREFT